jgi:hypothetical protein
LEYHPEEPLRKGKGEGERGGEKEGDTCVSTTVGIYQYPEAPIPRGEGRNRRKRRKGWVAYRQKLTSLCIP